MNKLLKALVMSFALYLSHIVILSVLSLFIEERGMIDYGVIGGAVYIFVIAFWAYYLLSLLYLLLAGMSDKMLFKISVAVVIMLIGYTLSRAGDMIDGDFVRKFRAIPFVLFLLSSFLIVLFDQLINRRNSRRRQART